MEAWKFATLFLLIWLPLWGWFESLTREPTEDDE